MQANTPFQEEAINAIRFLSADAVQKANSGHSGMPMGAAAIAYTLFTRYLRFNPANPKWFDRDRFVLSAGHGSMLLYSLLYLSGYGKNDHGPTETVPPVGQSDSWSPDLDILRVWKPQQVPLDRDWQWLWGWQLQKLILQRLTTRTNTRLLIIPPM
jgi:hypothetical protein